MFRNQPPTIWYAFVFAIVGGTVLALGHIVGGLVLTVLAVFTGWAAFRTAQDGDDHSGWYGN